jgi:hypothetical protein
MSILDEEQWRNYNFSICLLCENLNSENSLYFWRFAVDISKRDKMFVYSVLAVQDKNANLQFSIKMPLDGLLQLGLHAHEGRITSCKLHMNAKCNF